VSPGNPATQDVVHGWGYPGWKPDTSRSRTVSLDGKYRLEADPGTSLDRPKANVK